MSKRGRDHDDSLNNKDNKNLPQVQKKLKGLGDGTQFRVFPSEHPQPTVTPPHPPPQQYQLPHATPRFELCLMSESGKLVECRESQQEERRRRKLSVGTKRATAPSSGNGPRAPPRRRGIRNTTKDPVAGPSSRPSQDVRRNARLRTDRTPQKPRATPRNETEAAAPDRIDSPCGLQPQSTVRPVAGAVEHTPPVDNGGIATGDARLPVPQGVYTAVHPTSGVHRRTGHDAFHAHNASEEGQRSPWNPYAHAYTTRRRRMSPQLVQASSQPSRWGAHVSRQVSQTTNDQGRAEPGPSTSRVRNTVVPHNVVHHWPEMPGLYGEPAYGTSSRYDQGPSVPTSSYSSLAGALSEQPSLTNVGAPHNTGSAALLQQPAEPHPGPSHRTRRPAHRPVRISQDVTQRYHPYAHSTRARLQQPAAMFLGPSADPMLPPPPTDWAPTPIAQPMQQRYMDAAAQYFRSDAGTLPRTDISAGVARTGSAPSHMRTATMADTYQVHAAPGYAAVQEPLEYAGGPSLAWSTYAGNAINLPAVVPEMRQPEPLDGAVYAVTGGLGPYAALSQPSYDEFSSYPDMTSFDAFRMSL